MLNKIPFQDYLCPTEMTNGGGILTSTSWAGLLDLPPPPLEWLCPCAPAITKGKKREECPICTAASVVTLILQFGVLYLSFDHQPERTHRSVFYHCQKSGWKPLVFLGKLKYELLHRPLLCLCMCPFCNFINSSALDIMVSNCCH